MFRLLQVPIIVTFSFFVSTSTAAGTICESWAEKRDGELFENYKTIAEEYGSSLDKQQLWLNELEVFIEEDAEWNLKAQKLTDFFLLGFSTTADTIKVAMCVSGICDAVDSSKTVTTLEKVRNNMQLLQSKSVEEAMSKHLAKGSGIKHVFKSFTIIKNLIDAKERFADRDETMASLSHIRKQLQRNVDNAKRDFKKTSTDLEFQTKFKNTMDGQCNRIAEDARRCVTLGEKPHNSDSRYDSYLIRNECDADIIFFWCIEDDRKNRCGENKIFYAYSKKISPGDLDYNQYSLNKNYKLRYGACFGKYLNVGKNVMLNDRGVYQCLKP